HKESERALRRESEMNRVLIENAPVAIGLLSPDARLQRVNPAAEKLFGFKAEEVVGRNIWDIPVMMADDVSASKKRFQSLLQGAERVEAMLPMRTKSGEVRFVSSETTAVRTNGQIDHLVTTGIDVTERKRLEAEVIRVAEQEHVRIGADLHDGVGQTLTGVASLMEALVQGLDGPTRGDAERIHELLKTAQDEVRRLSHGLSPAAVRNRGLAGGLRLIAETIRLNFRRECDCVVEESIKPGNPEAETHLFRIAQEAVNNALRHGGARKIRLSLRRHDKTTGILEVTDDGSGFPTKKKAVEGNSPGIGLRVMEYRASLIGGQLKVSAQQGRGVRVTCLFPTSFPRDRKLTTL
ncbi:MAG: PAS domain S-box protein, partial [Verrucomicrobiaceae bacterium]|nr:PAS domain S-box protein [Verrucomicrobiaceae bacterium]